MPNEVITPERMRVLLVALGAEQGSRHDTFRFSNIEAPIEHWATIWLTRCDSLILACAEWLESEAVSEFAEVEHYKLQDTWHTEINPHKSSVDRKFITGPFGTRVVHAAAEVAGMMAKGEKK